MFELLLRLVFSLAAVVGLMLLIARFAARRFKARPGAVVSIVHRQQISRHASVAVVTVGSRVLVLGATDQQVQMITELDPMELVPDEGAGADLRADLGTDPTYPNDELDVALPGLDDLRAPLGRPRPFAQVLRSATDRADAGAPRPVRPVALVPRAASAPGDGPLAGSLLSPATWRRAIDAVTGRAS